MNSKLPLLIFLCMFLIVGGISFVSAVECVPIPSEACTISSSGALDTGTYYLNGTTSNFAMAINQNDVIFDLNNSIIIGNFTSNSRCIISAKSNITIKNGECRNYYTIISLSSSGDNITLNNLTLKNANFTTLLLNGVTNVTIINNNFYQQIGYYTKSHVNILNGTNNLLIENNTFKIDTYQTSPFIYNEQTNPYNIGLIINNNNFTGMGNLTVIQALIRHNNNIDNITLKNNNIYNLTIFTSTGNNTNNIKLENNYIQNSYATLYNTGNFTNININNNTFYDSRVNVNTGNVYNLWFYNNNISNTTLDDNIVGFTSAMNTMVFRGYEVNNINIYNNEFYYNIGTSSSAANFIRFYLLKANNISITGNNFNKSSLPILLSDLPNSKNITIYNNQFENHRNDDSYQNAILMNYVNDVNISKNYFYDSCAPILIHNSTNTNYENNYFNINKAKMLSEGNTNCAYEPISAINIMQIWKTWTPIAPGAEDRNYFLAQISQNVTIRGNNFTNYDTYLRLQGTINVTHDLNNYWYRKYGIWSSFLEPSIYYINNQYNNLTTLQATTDNTTQRYSDLLGTGWGSSVNGIREEYKLYNSFLWIKNVNNSQTYNNSFYNLTNALIYFDNQTVLCNSINSCDNDMNLSLAPQNTTYVLDNFNLTEGISRQYSPLWFSSSSSTEKHIASNLSDTINDVTVIINADCDSVGTIYYTSDTGAYTHTYEEGDYTCTNNQATLIIDGIEPATGSNTLRLVFDGSINDICEESDVTFLEATTLAGMILTVLLIGTALAFVILSFQGTVNIGSISKNDFTLENLVGGVIIIGLLFLIIATMAFLIGGSYCPAIIG